MQCAHLQSVTDTTATDASFYSDAELGYGVGGPLLGHIFSAAQGHSGDWLPIVSVA